jgi:hypothetical protein
MIWMYLRGSFGLRAYPLPTGTGSPVKNQGSGSMKPPRLQISETSVPPATSGTASG